MKRLPAIFLFAAWLPCLHLATVIALAWWLPLPLTQRIVFATAVLLLLPPLLARLCLLGIRPGLYRLGSPVFWRFWLASNCQMLFNRLPWFEEVLRLLPGIYALWLRLWGGKVHPLVLWGPGALVLDRGLVVVERGAVIGTRAILSGHLYGIDDTGAFLRLGPCHVGAGAVVGSGCSLAPMSAVAAGACLPATVPLPPEREWRDGKRHPWNSDR